MAEITEADRYKEQYAHFRSMNDILYKIPPLFTAVIGGLWYFAATNIEKYSVISDYLTTIKSYDMLVISGQSHCVPEVPGSNDPVPVYLLFI